MNNHKKDQRSLTQGGQWTSPVTASREIVAASLNHVSDEIDESTRGVVDGYSMLLYSRTAAEAWRERRAEKFRHLTFYLTWQLALNYFKIWQ